METEFKQITVKTGEPLIGETFKGRWLVEPDADETCSRAGGDAGAYWGVALTANDRFAVYVAHVNELWPARLMDFDTLNGAADGGVPADILARAAEAMGEERAIQRDI